MTLTATVGILLFVLLIIFLLLKIPVAYSLIGASLITILVIGLPLEVGPQRLFTSLDSFSFLAIPFFILAGNLMGAGGISQKLVNFANSLVGHLPGGLAIVTVISCMFFAAISGSGAATVAAVGGVLIPHMIESGYSPGFSAAVNASAGGIGIIIPPSIPFVSYAVLTGASVTELFTGGISAGIVIGLCLIIAVVMVSKKRGYSTGRKYSGRERLKAFVEAIPALLMPLIILGGIYSGKFNATESAVVAVVYSLIVGIFVYRTLTPKKIWVVFKESAVSTAQILMLVAGATLFGWLLTNYRVATAIAEGVLSLTTSPILLLLLMNLILLLMGTFMDTVASIVIVTPIMYPIATQIGMDPVHFGIMMCANLAIGQITPPFGVNLFVAAGIGKTKLEAIIKELLPLFLAIVIAVLMITYIEPISMFLVHLMRQ
ncbi:MAG: TRAP transporter large permease [Eubacteriales bacterium]|nr:TRAP transporter large permease [Eubacteriales bacterium]